MASAQRQKAIRRYFEYSETGVHVDEDGLKEIPFGEFLVERGVLSREQLFYVLSYQDRNPGVRLGEIAAALGYIQYTDVDRLVTEFHRVPQVEVG